MAEAKMECNIIPNNGCLEDSRGIHKNDEICKYKKYTEAQKRHYIPKGEITEVFEKHFKYPPVLERRQLPPPEELFGEYYQLESLQRLKAELNRVKSKLNRYALEDWSGHTHHNDPAGRIQWLLKNETRAELATVAWCKFYECLHQYPLVKGPKFNSLHLCEAPGAFITSLNHYLHSNYQRDEIQWNWLSTTLNPYYEGNALGNMIIDDRFILYTFDRWLFHADFTGNIISRTNIESMQRHCDESLPGGVQLITADGSIDCVETPDSQEEHVALLNFAEICAALTILEEGGCFVLKLFTLFEASTVSKMYLLNCVFDEVHVFKPATSKRGNSENYVICLGFRKQQSPNLEAALQIMKTKLSEREHVVPMFRKSHIPNDFLLGHEICTRLFMNFQISAIQYNIETFEIKPSREESHRTTALRVLVADEYFKRYDIKPLPEELTILYNRKGRLAKSISTFIYKGSYADRKNWKITSKEEQIFKYRKVLNELEKSLSGSYGILLEESREPQRPPSEIKLFHGEAFEMLRSSLFASVHILLMRQQLIELFQLDPLQQSTPKCVLITSSTAIAVESSPHLNFSIKQLNFMLSILLNILEVKPQKVVFSGYAFLTHLPVSILRYLVLNCYRKFSISIESGFEITLEECDYDGETVKVLETLIRILQNERTVCVMDFKDLHCNEFCSALTEFNNLLLLNNFKLMLMH